jgi:hypothetical protein
MRPRRRESVVRFITSNKTYRPINAISEYLRFFLSCDFVDDKKTKITTYSIKRVTLHHKYVRLMPKSIIPSNPFSFYRYHTAQGFGEGVSSGNILRRTFVSTPTDARITEVANQTRPLFRTRTDLLR